MIRRGIGVQSFVSAGGDADAQAFITAAGITDATQQLAITTLVTDLKSYGIWSKMKAIYPFVGGTSSTHKWNLKDPRDLDAAFRLVFNGGWTHNNNGGTPNGVNANANTYLTPGTHLSTTSAHINYYAGTVNNGAVIIGNGNLSCYIQRTETGLEGSLATSSVSSVSNNNTAAFYMLFRPNNTQQKIQKNSSIILTDNKTSSNYSGGNIYIASYGASALFGTSRCQFASIGDGLTDTEAANLSITVEKYQTTLGRSVNPWYDNGNLLLDLYPSASAAYSTRKLRNYYIGAAIRVRRSSDNAEQDIYFDVNGNLNESALTTFVGSGSAFVTTWYDQSGNSINATQSIASNQPRIVNSGTIDKINNKISMVFDGVNDTLTNTTTGFAVNNLTHYAVCSRSTNDATFRTVYSTGILAGTIGFGFFYWSTNNLYQQIRNAGVTAISIGDYSNTINTNTLIFGVGTSSTDYVYFNGGNEKTQSHSRANVNSNGRISIGSRLSENTFVPENLLNGTVTEIVFWSANNLSARTNIESNVNNYYSLY